MATMVLYGLETLNITLRDIHRLQTFEHRTIRRILRIPASMISHISNDIVITRSRVECCLPNILLKRQLQLLGHLIRASPKDPTGIVCLEPTRGISVRKLPQGFQRRGYRSTELWFERIKGQISKDFNLTLASDRAEWRNAIQRRCEGARSRCAFGRTRLPLAGCFGFLRHLPT